MLLYNLRIALLSLRRNRVLTGVIVGGIALGIAVATLSSTIRHSLAKDPLPGRSDHLHYVRLDSWDPLRPYPGDDPNRPPTQLTYQDAMNLMRSDVPARQSAMYKATAFLFPDPRVGRARRVTMRLAFADFFAMFDVPFRYGAGWDRQADLGPDPVIVLDEETNDAVFGGEDSVGRTVRLGDREFRVIGVLGRWRPPVKFYDVTQSPIQTPENVFIPFHHARPMQIRSSGNSDGWKSAPGPGFEGLLASEQCWIQFWAELPPDRVEAYRSYLDAYVLEQKKTGRFPRPLNNRVTPMMAWMKEQNVVPNEVNAMAAVSLLFLAVCALNLMGLLLGKFLARAPEIGVRRALGARRLDVFIQHVVECELVAVVGGVIGVLIALLALSAVNRWADLVLQRTDMFHLDGAMLAFAFLLSLTAGLIAGLYPAWRVCRIPPAIHLKVQ